MSCFDKSAFFIYSRTLLISLTADIHDHMILLNDLHLTLHMY